MFDEYGDWDGIILDEWMSYLDELRESGRTNMLGAGSFLVEEYGLKPRDARKVVQYWMENFNG